MLRPWEFRFLIRRRLQTPVYLQIAHALIDEIRRGRLGSGAALPGTRELAASLKLNRKTIVQAYEELAAQGWVQNERTRGTFVSSHLPTIERPHESAASTRPDRMPEVADFHVLGAAPDIPLSPPLANALIFDDGAPVPAMCPSSPWHAPIATR